MGACATKPKAASDPADAPPPLLSREVDEAACAVTEAKGEEVKADANPEAKRVEEEEEVDDGSRRRSLGHLLKENEEEKKSESTEADKPAPTEEPKQVTPEAQPQPPNAETTAAIAATTATEVKVAEPEQPPKHAVVEEVKVQEEQGGVQETKVPVEATAEPTKAAEVAAAVEAKEEKPELPVSQVTEAAVAEEKH